MAWLLFRPALSLGRERNRYGVTGAWFPWLSLWTPARLSDQWGRDRVIPIAMAVSALSSVTFIQNLSVVLMPFLVTLLSLGCDTVLPSLAAIVTDLTAKRGSAVGLFAFALFTGSGLGSLVFSMALRLGIDAAFISFGLAGLLGAFLAVLAFRTEGVDNSYAPHPVGSVGVSPPSSRQEDHLVL